MALMLGAAGCATSASTTNAKPTSTGSATRATGWLAAPPNSTDDHTVCGGKYPLSTGLDDVDGDGRADRIAVNAASGAITVRTSNGRRYSAGTFPDSTAELDAIADLAHDGRGFILVSMTADGAGCYHPGEATITVLGVVGGSLRHFTTADGGDPLSYNEGRGDFYSGFSCPVAGVVTQTGGRGPNPDGGLDVWTTKTYHLTDTGFVLVGTQTHHGTQADLLAATATTNCPGLTADASAA